VWLHLLQALGPERLLLLQLGLLLLQLGLLLRPAAPAAAAAQPAAEATAGRDPWLLAQLRLAAAAGCPVTLHSP
jgi:hypothetical protein